METTVAGITYTLPQVYLLQESGLGTSEFAGRTAYDSFASSENPSIIDLNKVMNDTNNNVSAINHIHKIESSKLLDSLAWVHHHHSVIEHCNLTFAIRGTSRGVLQEIVRHRIASYTVRSTRYTMSSIINAFVAEMSDNPDLILPSAWFYSTVRNLDLFVTADETYNKLQILDIFNKLTYQRSLMEDSDFTKLTVAKSSLHYLEEYKPTHEIFDLLQEGKKKRNVGDAFKHIVNDNFKTDLVLTFNLRSLKNFFELRDSGAAYFLIRKLALAMKISTPKKYLDLIIKKN